VFPLSCLVVTYFWTLNLIDDTLVLADNPRDRHGYWYNHIVHTFILPAVVLQSNASYHRVPSSRWRSMAISAIFGTTYFFWLIAIGCATQQWPYGLMRKRPKWEVTAVMSFAIVVLCLFNKLGRWFHLRVWIDH